LIDYVADENLKTTLVGEVQPRVVVLKNGKVYVVSSMRDTYHQVYDLLKDGAEFDKRYVGPVIGRFTLAGLYAFYIIKELRLK
jgi:hypothetical protein